MGRKVYLPTFLPKIYGKLASEIYQSHGSVMGL